MRVEPLRVGVLVDLARGPAAGGHVRIWERLAEAAVGNERLDLTVHFSGPREGEQVLGPNVRLVEHRSVFSTDRLPFLSHVPAHTDLAPFHRPLARRLSAHQVLHTTDAFFAFARTAAWVARRMGIVLCNSVHTDTPSYTRVYTAATIERLVGRGGLSHLLIERLALPLRAQACMRRWLEQHQARCAFALASRPEEAAELRGRLPPDRVGLLRRGVDRQRFNPRRRDRRALLDLLGVPPETVVVLFAGRLDRGKNVMVLVEAVRTLAAEGLPVFLLCAGNGADRSAVIERLGPHGSCPGQLAPDQLAMAYASADVFAQPSIIEECSNVVLEALSSGLPVVVAQGGGSSRLFPVGEAGLVVSDASGPAGWTEALRGLVTDHPRRVWMAETARSFAENLPTWRDVLTQDLLPVWQRVAGRAGVSRDRGGP